MCLYTIMRYIMKEHNAIIKSNENAQLIIDDKSLLTLNHEAALMLISALDQPAQENVALQKASQAYKSQNQDSI